MDGFESVGSELPEDSSRRRKRDLSDGRVRLLELMQRIHFGRIEKLQISAGEPVAIAEARIVHVYKLKGENGRRPELALADFVVKDEIRTLFRFFDELQDGEIDLIDVKHGLPFLIEVKDLSRLIIGDKHPVCEACFLLDSMPAVKRRRLWVTPIMARLASPPLFWLACIPFASGGCPRLLLLGRRESNYV